MTSTFRTCDLKQSSAALAMLSGPNQCLWAFSLSQYYSVFHTILQAAIHAGLFIPFSPAVRTPTQSSLSVGTPSPSSLSFGALTTSSPAVKTHVYHIVSGMTSVQNTLKARWGQFWDLFISLWQLDLGK